MVHVSHYPWRLCAAWACRPAVFSFEQELHRAGEDAADPDATLGLDRSRGLAFYLDVQEHSHAGDGEVDLVPKPQPAPTPLTPLEQKSLNQERGLLWSAEGLLKASGARLANGRLACR